MKLPAATRMRRHRDQIVRDCMRRAREQVAGARQTDDETLRDSLPQYLDGLARVMETRSVAAADNLEISRLHAEQRSRLPGYRVADVVLEYRILRKTIFEAIESDGTLDPPERDILHEAIDAGIGQAGAAFMQAQMARSEGNIRDLEAERKARVEFVSTLTHDLRNPLGVARLALQRILLQAGLPDPLRAPAVKAIQNIDRVDRMIQDLLDVDRIRVGARLPVDLAATDLVAIVREVLDDLSATHGERFVLNAPPQVRGWFSKDGIRRVVENLSINAVKYGAPASPIDVTLTAQDDRVSLTVHNDGDSPPPEERAHLFDPFRRARSADAGSKHGWGLGLTLVRGVAEAHGGSVEIGSAGSGFTVIVKLPCDARPYQSR